MFDKVLFCLSIIKILSQSIMAYTDTERVLTRQCGKPSPLASRQHCLLSKTTVTAFSSI